MNAKTLCALALTTLCLATAAQAATVTSTMPVKITIQKACAITTAPAELDFGTQGPLLANIDQQTTMSVTCTNLATYNIGLDGGTSGNVTARTMVNGAAKVNYALFRDSARTLNWGTVTADTLAGTGNGNAQTITVYGRVPAQTTPAAQVYADTVNVTVTF